MSLRKADISKFDPNGAGEENGNIFGLGFEPQECNIILIPVPWEVTTSYGRGAAKGPKAILKSSPQLDLFDAQLGKHGLSRPWEFGIWMEPEDQTLRKWNKEGCKLALPIIEAGGKIASNAKLENQLTTLNTLSEQLNDWVKVRTEKWLAEDKIVGIVGGDHSVPFGAIEALAEKHPGMGILHFDAHADLRHAYEGFEFSHASIMNNVIRRIPGIGKLVQVGIRDFCDEEFELASSHPKIETFYDFEIKERLFEGENWMQICSKIIEKLPEKVFVSFDIDGLDPSYCPHTGTPVAGGMHFSEAMYLLYALALSGKTIVGFDLNEVAPGGKGNEWDGNVGARILYRLCAATLYSQGARTAMKSPPSKKRPR